MILFLMISKMMTMMMPLLMAMAYLTLTESKMLSAMQMRKGPNVVGMYGMLQPLADGLKLLLKETMMPNRANTIIFIIAPMMTFTLSLINWTIIPFDKNLVLTDMNIGVLYIFAISSLGVYGMMTSGWSSNSKYAFLGSLRSASQMISYEVSIGLIIVCVLLLSNSLNLTTMVKSQEQIWYVMPLFPLFMIFFISMLAETNSPPFDLPEAEAELVSGYNVEYSGMGFALFFLGEYGNMMLMSSFTVILFFGGWNPLMNMPFISNLFWFSFKVLFFMYSFILMRATYPSYSYDQLMSLGWKMFLPISLAWVMFLSGILIAFEM